MKRFFKWLFLLIIALAVGVAVLLYNPHIIKGPLERYLSDLAGYTITLDGELEIETGRLIELSARNIRISGPDWANREELLAVGHLNLKLNTASIFTDIVLIESLQVDDLQLNLETNAEGTGNWITANKPSSPADKKSDKDSAKDGDRTIVIFNDIQASNTTFRFRNGKTDVENVFDIASLSHQQQADGMLHTVLHGDLNNRVVEYTHTVGPYKNLLNGRDVSYTAAGHFGELKLNGDAFIDNLLEPHHPTFNLDLQGPNIDEITAMLGIDDLGGGGFSLRAKGAQTNGTYEADINGKVGDISLSASAQASDIAQLNELDLSMAINGPSLGSFTRVFGLEHWPDKPFSLKGKVERVGQTLNVRDLTLNIGGARLLLDALLTNFPSLEASRIKLSISGDDVTQFHELLGIQAIATGAFDINGRLDVSAEGLELIQVELNTSLGEFTLSGTLGSPPGYIGSKLQLHLDSHNAHSLISILGIDALPEQAFNLNARVEVVEHGVNIERGVLVTIGDERLELGGFISFKPGLTGSDVDIGFSGQNLAQVLSHLSGDFLVPDRPYELKGRVRLLEEGVQLDGVEAEFEGIRLKTDGLIRFGEHLLGTGLAFQIHGENLSSLSTFEAIGDSLSIFVPGQPYQATGRFEIVSNGWQLRGVKGRIGGTDLNFDSLISNRAAWTGSNIDFSIKGPGLDKLLAYESEVGLPPGAFNSTGQISLSEQALSINNLNFETDRAHGKVDLKFGWPFSSTVDLGFNVNVWGDDIRQLLPKTGSFQADMANFKLNAVGNKRGDLLSVQEFDANIGKLRIALKGEMDSNPTNDKVDIAFSVLSEDISKLGRLKGEQLPALPLNIKADFQGNARQFMFRNLDGSLGESRLNGSLDVSLKGPKPIINAVLTSEYFDLRPFLSAKDPVDETVAATKPDRLIPATPLPLDAFDLADIDVNLNIAEMRYQQDSITDLTLEVGIKAGSLKIPEFSYEAPRGNVRVSLSVNPTDTNKADVKIDFNTEKLVFNATGLPDNKLDQIPALDIDLHVAGKGGNLQEVAGSLNGSVFLGSHGGTIEGVDLSILESYILSDIFKLIMPKTDKDPGTHLTCGATILQITDGLAATNPALAFTTDKITVIAKGTLDLKTEKMNFDFNATPKNILKINAGEMFHPFILISGTLANPAVGVDPGKAVLHGGAAIATLGISVLAKGVVDRLDNAVPICEEMLKKAPKKK